MEKLNFTRILESFLGTLGVFLLFMLIGFFIGLASR